MNLYFLVEGKRTERRVYPKWLSYLLPRFTQVDKFDEVIDKNYFLISGEGYPALLDRHLPNAVRDFNRVPKYSHLVVCLDAEEMTPADCVAQIEKRMMDNSLAHGELQIVVQNRSIETWFLGNRRMLTRGPQSATLAEYIQFFDVSSADPEQMGIFPEFSTHAQFHGAYLRAMFREKQISYTKQRPGHVADESYLRQLLNRISGEPHHLKTFQSFISFCEYVATVTGHTDA